MNREEQMTKLSHEIERILTGHGRPKILGSVIPSYDHENSRHPEQIRASFDDGSTAIYDLRVEQPVPSFVECIRIIRKWKTGYAYKPTRRRARR